MLILPMVNKKKVLTLLLELKDAEKIRTGVHYDDTSESEIIVNKEKFTESTFKDSKSVSAPIDFIRSKSLLHPRNFLVTTKMAKVEKVSTITREVEDTLAYDVYEVGKPPKRVNESLDNLYGKVIKDLQNEIPGTDGRGRYVSFEDLGVDKYLTDEKIARLQKIVREERDESLWPKLFEEAGIADLKDTIDFVNNFKCTILDDATIPEESLQDTLSVFSILKTRDYKNLNKYYRIAKSNTEIYTKISYISKIIYDKPLTLIQINEAKHKQLIKKKDKVEHVQAA